MHPSPPHPVTGIGQPAFLYTSDTRILEANGPAEALAGQPLAGLCLAELAALFAPRALDGTRLSITRLPACRALGGEDVIETPIAIRATDGRIMSFLVTATPLSDGANVGGALEIWQPDDGRCQLSVPEPALADAPRPPGMIVLLDANGTILDLDDAFAGILGRPARELVGANAWRVFPIVPGARIRERFLRAFTSWRPLQFEEVFDGLLFEGLVLPVRSAAGTVDQAVIVLRDVTGRRRSEEALRESEARYRRFVDADISAHVVTTSDGRILDSNPAFARIFGFASPGEARSVGIIETYCTPAERDVLLDRLRAEGRIENVEGYRRRRDGNRIHVVANLVGDFDEEGTLTGIIEYITEDTQRYRAEAALRRSEAQLRLAQESAGIGLWDRDTATDRVTVSPEFLRLYGLEELSSAPYLDFERLIHPADRHIVRAGRLTAFGTGEPLELEIRIVLPGGEQRWILFRGREVRDRPCDPAEVIGLLIDVTDRKSAELALAESEADARSFFLNMIDPCAICEPLVDDRGEPVDIRLVDVNPALGRELSLPPEAIVGRTAYSILPEMPKKWLDVFLEASFNRAFVNIEEPFPALGRWYHITGFPVRRGRMAVVFRDITERRLAEESLRSSEERLRLGQESAEVATWDWIPATGAITFTPEFLQSYGVRAGAIRDYPTWRRLVHPDDIERVEAERDAAIARDEPFELEFRVVTPSGAVRWVSVVGRGITDVRGRLLRVIGMNLDVTDRRENEVERERFTQELQRSNEELQRFAYVASHDLQEPLRSIVSFSQLLERRYRGRLDADADDYIAFIVDGGMRMQQLIQDLLQLSRVETTAAPLAPTDASTVVADALRMLDTPIHEAGAMVEVGALPMVMADAAQLGQVFSNLVGNAIKYRREGVPSKIRISARRLDRMVEFSVADTGIGIAPRDFDRIFVIFQRLHTTDEYPGTGIGLAVAKKIVERHGGRIRVESTPGEGSTFFFTLPTA